MEARVINKKNKIFFFFDRICKFETRVKKIIEKITGIEAGLEANNKSIIKKSSK